MYSAGLSATWRARYLRLTDVLSSLAVVRCMVPQGYFLGLFFGWWHSSRLNRRGHNRFCWGYCPESCVGNSEALHRHVGFLVPPIVKCVLFFVLERVPWNTVIKMFSLLLFSPLCMVVYSVVPLFFRIFCNNYCLNVTFCEFIYGGINRTIYFYKTFYTISFQCITKSYNILLHHFKMAFIKVFCLFCFMLNIS